MTTDLRAAIEREIAHLEDAAQFVLRSNEKIVPMGHGEVTRLAKLLRTLLDAVKGLGTLRSIQRDSCAGHASEYRHGYVEGWNRCCDAIDAAIAKESHE